MIPLVALKALPWRLIGYGAAVAVLLACGWRVNQWRQGYHARAAAEARTAEIAQQSAAAMALLAERHRQALEASSGYQKELAEIAARPPVSGPIRLCIKPNVPPGGSGGSAPGGPSPTVPPGGVVPGGDGPDHQEGPDIAADLDAFARKCEAVAARGRALQGLK